MAGLKERVREQPLLMATVALLFGLSCIFFPTGFFGPSLTARLFAGALVRCVFAGLGLFFLIAFGLADLLKIRVGRAGVGVLLVALLVVMNNFPFLPLAQGTVTLSEGGIKAFAFVLQCLSVGLFEEIYFRGLIFTILLLVLPDTKKGQLGAIALSSVVFGLTHLANLFGGGAPLAVLAQIGYSAAIGAMLAAVLLGTRSLIWPVLLHALFDVGGMMTDTLGGGQLWTTANVAVTAVVAVGAAVFFALRFALGKKAGAFWPNRPSGAPCGDEPGADGGETCQTDTISVSGLPDPAEDAASAEGDVENHHDQKTDDTADDR